VTQFLGTIAYSVRGTCQFAQKAFNCEQAGAIGLVIRDNVVADLPMNMDEVLLIQRAI